MRPASSPTLDYQAWILRSINERHREIYESANGSRSNFIDRTRDSVLMNFDSGGTLVRHKKRSPGRSTPGVVRDDGADSPDGDPALEAVCRRGDARVRGPLLRSGS